MKKTLIVAAALSAMAASTMAAGVTLYGVVDQGLFFKNVKNGYTGETTRTFTMESGLCGASRFGFKGTEDLGNGYSAGFILESGIKADDGSYSGSLFNRLSVLQVGTPFGAFQIGRMGTVTGGTSGGVMTDGMGATGTSFKAAGTEALMVTTMARFNNGVEYKSPKMAGFQATVQYSLGTDTDNGNLKNSKTFFGGAIQYTNGSFAAAAGYDRTKPAYHGTDGKNENNQETVLGYASYDFGVAKMYLGAQYNRHKLAPGNGYTLLGAGKYDDGDYNSYVFHVAAGIPCAGGTLMPQVGYFKANDKSGDDNDIKGFNVGLTYKYSLSKRTTVYGTAAYQESKDDFEKVKYTQVGVGLRHNF